MTGKPIEARLRARVLRLSAVAQGIAFGITFAVMLFVATNWLVLKGGDVVGPHLGLLGQYMVGYEVSFVGSLIGAAYAFAAGFAAGAIVSAVYNRVADWREQRRAGEG